MSPDDIAKAKELFEQVGKTERYSMKTACLKIIGTKLAKTKQKSTEAALREVIDSIGLLK